jgi:hypothetical protein
MEHQKLSLEAHPGSIKAHPETVEAHFEAMKAHFLKLLHILESFGITWSTEILEDDHGARNALPWSYSVLLWSYVDSPGICGGPVVMKKIRGFQYCRLNKIRHKNREGSAQFTHAI